jgi:hypothetical protein
MLPGGTPPSLWASVFGSERITIRARRAALNPPLIVAGIHGRIPPGRLLSDPMTLSFWKETSETEHFNCLASYPGPDILPLSYCLNGYAKQRHPK